jgi:hypothetical protein
MRRFVKIYGGKPAMRTARLIIALLLLFFINGCAMEKEEPSYDMGREKVITMDQAITDYLENNIIPIPPPIGVKTFVAYDLFGVSGNGNETTAYLWALIKTYGVEPEIGIGPRSGSSLPLVLTLKEESGSFTVIGHRQPGDGSNWWPDVKQIFPQEYHQKIINYHKTGKVQELKQTIREKVNNYLKTAGIKDTV